MAGPGGRVVGRVSLRVAPDTSGFAQELRRFVQRVESTLSISIPVHIDSQRTLAELERLRMEIERRSARYRIEADTDAFRADVAMQLESLRGIAARIPLTPQTDRFHAEAEAEILRLQRMLELDIDLNVAGAAEARAEILARVAALQARLRANPVDIPLQVDRQNLRDTITHLGSVGDSAGRAAAGGLSQMRLALLALAVVGPVAVAAVGVALLALPGIIAGVMAPLAAVMVGLDGIKRAAESLKKPFDEMKKTISATFQKHLTPVFKQLRVVMEPLTKGLQSMAQGLSGVFKAAVDSITSKQGLATISAIFANIRKALDGLAPIVATATRTFLTLAEVGSRMLGPLNGVILDFATRFDDMVQKFAKSGQLDKAFAALGEVIGGLLDVLLAFFDFAVKNSDLLKVLGTVLSGIATALSAAGTGLSVFTTALSGNSELGKFAGILGTINDAGVILGDWVRIAADAVVVFFDAFTGNSELGEFSGHLGTINDLGVTLGDNFRGFADAVSTFFAALTGNSQLGEFSGHLQSINDAGIQLGDAIRALGGAFQGLWNTIVPIVEDISASVNVNWSEISAVTGKVFQAIGAIITIALTGIRLQIEAWTGIIKAIWMVFGSTITSVVNATWPYVQRIIKGVCDVIIGISRAFSAAVSGDWRAMGEAIKTTIRSAMDTVKATIEGAVAAVETIGSKLYNVGVDMISGLIDGIRDMADRAAAAAKKVVLDALQAAKDAIGIGSPSKVFRDEVGAMIGAGIALGIDDSAAGIEASLTSAISPRRGTLTALVGAAPAVASPGTSPLVSFGDLYAVDTTEAARLASTRMTDALVLMGV